jgi:hypothetical protein
VKRLPIADFLIGELHIDSSVPQMIVESQIGTRQLASGNWQSAIENLTTEEQGGRTEHELGNAV